MPLFRDFDLAAIVARALHNLDRAGDCAALAWVVMPDHVHALLELHGGELADVVRAFKGRTARRLNVKRSATGRVWQRGFHDHALRVEEDVAAAARYIVANPLRAGVARRLRAYPFWNARWL